MTRRGDYEVIVRGHSTRYSGGSRRIALEVYKACIDEQVELARQGSVPSVVSLLGSGLLLRQYAPPVVTHCLGCQGHKQTPAGLEVCRGVVFNGGSFTDTGR